MKKICILIISALFLFISCEHVDLVLTQRVDELENRFSQLERECDELNTNITALQTLVNVLQEKDYVTSVEPLTSSGKEVGYVLTFSKSGSITIYHGQNGQDGQDGHSPVIGINQDRDGKYYWTLDKEWLLDDSGCKIPAEGEIGITPQVKIEDGFWYESHDEGKTWNKLGKAVGEKGDSFFQNVDVSNKNYVVFILADGTRLEVPKFKDEKFDITFENMKDIFCDSGEKVEIPFTIVGSENAQVECLGENGWQGSVFLNGKYGHITVMAPTPYINGKILVFATDGDSGKLIIKSLTFTNRIFTITNEDYITVPNTTSSVEIDVKTTIQYEVSIPSDAKRWLHYVRTRAARIETVYLRADNNSSYESRSTTVTLKAKNGPEYREVTIVQEGKELPYKAIDLGLSVKWSNVNLGTTAQEGTGKYYMWGDPTGTHDFIIDECPDVNNISSTQYDAAKASRGGKWRIPTENECKELINYCTWERIRFNGVSGMRVTGRNGNWIFLPCTGMGMPKDGPIGSMTITDTSNGYYMSANSMIDYGSRMAIPMFFDNKYASCHRTWNASFVKFVIRPVEDY